MIFKFNMKILLKHTPQPKSMFSLPYILRISVTILFWSAYHIHKIYYAVFLLMDAVLVFDIS